MRPINRQVGNELLQIPTYVAVGAVVAYLVVLGGVFVLASELVVNVLIAGIVGLLAVAFGSGVMIYTRGRRPRSGDGHAAGDPTPSAE